MIVPSKNSFLYWYPKIAALPNVPIPKTKIFHLVDDDAFVLRANRAEFARNHASEIDALLADFCFPLFLKTDELAGKHDWKDTCFVPAKDVLYQHMQNLVYCCDMLDIPCLAFVFREKLDLHTSFTFFLGDMPVSKERRYFVERGSVICHHPYWDVDVFEQAFASEDDVAAFLQQTSQDIPYTYKFSPERRDEIRQLVQALNTESPDEIDLLSDIASRVSSVLDGAWSVDFACDVHGKWWLIDMALAQDSWHPNACIHAKQWQKN